MRAVDAFGASGLMSMTMSMISLGFVGGSGLFGVLVVGAGLYGGVAK